MADKTYTITGGPLKPHEYVVIKREMSAADEAEIQNAASVLGGTKKKPVVQLTVGDIKLMALKVMITAWNLTETIQSPIDESTQDRPIPLSDAAIEALPSRIGRYINKKIDELNPEDDDDEEDFTSAASGRSEGSSPTTRKHRTSR